MITVSLAVYNMASNSDILSEILKIWEETSALGLGSRLSNPNIYRYLKSQTPFLKESATSIERAYCVINNVHNIPRCLKCENTTSYSTGKNGYRQFCSTVCANSYNISNRLKLRKHVQKVQEDQLVESINYDASRYNQTKLQQFITDNLLKKDGSLNGNLTDNRRNFINKFGISCCIEIFSDYEINYKNSITISEYFYIQLHGKKLCICGSKTSFVNFKKGYLIHCSTDCSNSNSVKVDVIRNKLLNPSSSALKKKEFTVKKRRSDILKKQQSIKPFHSFNTF